MSARARSSIPLWIRHRSRPHKLVEIPRHLERRRFKRDASGGNTEEEPKVDMDDVAIAQQQDVAVVAVLYVQEVAQHAVPGQSVTITQ